MKFMKEDLPRLRISLLVFLALTVCGAASVYLTNSAVASARRASEQARAMLEVFERKLRQVHDEENEIKEKAALFDTLQKRGILGEEQRLDWAELIEAIQTKERLFGIEYEMEPQRSLGADATGKFSFAASLMKVRFPLLHEEDLTRMIRELRQKAPALIRIRRCALFRQPGTEDKTQLPARLMAECRIDWITVRKIAEP